MSREPTYPKDARIGPCIEEGSTASENAGSASEAGSEKEEKGDPRRAKHLVTGAAIGIGSAAIVAALLYANRTKKGDKR